MSFITVYITCANMPEAEAIGRGLVEARLAACANIVPGLTSIYRWQDKVETAQEVALLLKTRAALFERLAAQVRARHGYTMPCIVAWPIVDGNDAYLNWIAANTLPESDGA